MPQARSGSGSGSGTSRRRTTGTSRSASSRAKSSGGRAKASGGRAKASGGRSAGATKSTRARSTSGRTKRSTSARKTTSRRTTRAKASPAEVRLEAAAKRLRNLNERIIDASRDAGETTLTSYERALKAIATSIEKGPGASDIEWVANLATAQAKFIRDLADSWTKQARKALR